MTGALTSGTSFISDENLSFSLEESLLQLKYSLAATNTVYNNLLLDLKIYGDNIMLESINEITSNLSINWPSSLSEKKYYAPCFLSRKLVNLEYKSRKLVLVSLINDLTGEKVMDTHTDTHGRFVMDTSNIPSWSYRLEYRGDSIKPSKWDPSESFLVSEDPITPWEYNITLVNSALDNLADNIPPDNSKGLNLEMED